MLVSVVIATKDRARGLECALDSLEHQENAPPFEVIVVDNGSAAASHATTKQRVESAIVPVTLLYDSEPNRGKARNRGVAAAKGEIVAFCDDDVIAPPGWVAAHAGAHAGAADSVVNGPILNVGSYEERPAPRLANFSRAFLCTCNVSFSQRWLQRVGGFDETFDLYGWEDTELGVRLRDAGARWKFAWDAYLWHVKAPDEHTVAVELQKAVEKARMAGRFLRKHPSRRARLATGAYRLNLFRGRFMLPDALLAVYAGLAIDTRIPPWMRSLARAQLVDGAYTRELARVIEKLK